jgi:hypothetical protein
MRTLFLKTSLCITLLLLTACSTGQKKNTEVIRWAEKCKEGSSLACYVHGVELRDQGKLKEAEKLLQQACSNGWAHACSDLSGVLWKLKKPSKLVIGAADKACQLGDAAGCYNAACAECSLHMNQDRTAQFLEKSFRLGFSDAAHAAKDKDLSCLKDDPRLTNYVERLKSRTDARSTAFTQIYVEPIATSFNLPFSKVESLSPLIVSDTESDARLLATGASVHVKTAIEEARAELAAMRMKDPTIELISSAERSVNGYPFFVQTVQYRERGLGMKSVTAIIGNEKFHSSISVTFLQSLESQLKEKIDAIFGSIVFNPDEIPDASSLPFAIDSKALGFLPAGFTGGFFVFNGSGTIDRESINKEPAVFIRSILVQKDKLQESLVPFFKSFENAQFTKVTSTFSVPTRKVTTLQGKVWNLYGRTSRGANDQNQPHELRNEILVLETPSSNLSFAIQLVSIKPQGSKPFTGNLERGIRTLRISDKTVKEILKPRKAPSVNEPKYSPTGTGALPFG